MIRTGHPHTLLKMAAITIRPISTMGGKSAALCGKGKGKEKLPRAWHGDVDVPMSPAHSVTSPRRISAQQIQRSSCPSSARCAMTAARNVLLPDPVLVAMSRFRLGLRCPESVFAAMSNSVLAAMSKLCPRCDAQIPSWLLCP